MRTIKELYDTYLLGDKLTNDELIVLHNHFYSAGVLLGQMGERFRFAFLEAISVSACLRTYATARGIQNELNA